MVLFLSENDAKKIFRSKYAKAVNAFSYDRTVKKCSDQEVKMDYLYPDGFVPSMDALKAIASGELKAKKVLNGVERVLRNPVNCTGADARLCVSTATFVNLLRETEKNPFVMVFVAKDETGENGMANKKMNKFMVKYLRTVFGFFGINVLTYDKEGKRLIKKIFGKKPGKKSFKKVRKDIRKYDVDCDDRSNIVNLSYLNILNKAYRPEMLYQSMMNNIQEFGGQRAIEGMSKKKRKNFALELMCMISGSDIEIYKECDIGDKKRDKKQLKKIVKSAKKMDEAMLEYYKEYRDTLGMFADQSGVEIPKIKKGMKTEKYGKILKFFSKEKNAYLLAGLCAHICSRRAGAAFGASDNTKAVVEVMSISNRQLANQYKLAAKKIAEALEKNANASNH